jgi:integral membrane protein (TIGR01906 family)
MVGSGADPGGGIGEADYDARVSGALARGIGSLIVALAAALVIVAGSVAPFLNPLWVSFEQDRSDAAAWTGYTPTELRSATDAILSDLVVGPPTFDVVVDGQPVLNDRERGHMADVRGVFSAFALVAVVALAVLIGGWRLAKRRAPEAYWRGIRGGVGLLVAGVVVVGAIGLVAFDLAFEIFHRLFFAGGTYTFDPRADRLVQLFPERFWLETSLAVGAVILVVSACTWWLAGRRLGHPAPASVGLTEPAEAGS